MPYAPGECGPTAAYRAYCERARAAGLARTLSLTPSGIGVADFSHNDYLGLAHDPRLAHAASRAAYRYGTGSGGSRLLSGTTALHLLLERRIARDKGAQAALLFPSGYQLNATVLAALLDARVLGQEAVVFADRRIHASLHHACTLAGVRQHRFAHNDLDHLETLLRKPQLLDRPRFIVTESVFGMDGDCSDIDRLRVLAREHNATLFVDEAHATGILGMHGYGLGGAVAADGGVVMGTFSKALGGAGGYLACSLDVRDYLVQHCGGFLYTTAPAPPTVAAAWCAWRLVPQLQPQRRRLLQIADDTRRKLQAAGFDTGNSTTHIIPILFNDERMASIVRERLRGHGVIVSAIRPPTIAPGQSRLRIAVCASHSQVQLDALVSALRQV